MKILLVGEFSGFYNNLADGLKILGHDVFLANTGDGYRNFYSDYNWMAGKKGTFGKVQGILNLIFHKSLFAGFDVVQVIVPKINSLLWLNKLFVKYLVNNNQSVFWTPAGAGDLIAKYWIESKGLRSEAYDHHFREAKKRNIVLNFEKQRFLDYEHWFLENINGIIPTIFEYAQPFRAHPKYLGTIPFPINTDKLKYTDNIVNKKVVFYHGITRPVKGTQYISKAFKIMQDKHDDIAEFICNTYLPYDEYIKVTNSANVIVDQTNGFSCGMNALISLAQGKIVLGGGDPLSFSDLGYKFCPVINITPNVNQICDAIEQVINNRDRIHEMGKESRKFIETYHDCKVVAADYIRKWSSV